MTTGTYVERIVAGDVKINSATIINNKNQLIDVSEITQSVTLYESIFSPFITGSIVISDAMALSELLPFVGEEILFLDIETPGINGNKETRRQLKFHLYRMGDKENLTLRNIVYKLDFISIEGFIDMNRSISRTYRGKISDTVKKIIETELNVDGYKKVIVENTSNTTVHTSNFWSPAKNIYFLSEQSLNELNNPNFLFFENNEGFIYASLDTLYSSPSVAGFIRDQKMRSSKDSANIEQEYNRIMDMSTPEFYNYIEDAKYGVFGGSVYKYDIQNKKLNYSVREAKTDYKKVTLNGSITKKTPFDPKSKIMVNIDHKNLYDDYQDVESDHYLKRMGLLRQIEKFKINIQVLGKIDYTVGRVIDLTVYSDNQIDDKTTDNQLVDPVLSGKYLITSLSHEVTKKNHVTNMEICKDTILETQYTGY